MRLEVPVVRNERVKLGKARRKVIKIDEDRCDGCGLCISACPERALHIIDGKAKLIRESFCGGLGTCIERCPLDALVIEEREAEEYDRKGVTAHREEFRPVLHQWPIQLSMVSPQASYFQNSNFVLVADCVPFAYAGFHTDFLMDKAIAVCCPKHDDIEDHIDKVAQILRSSNIKSLKVIRMDVLCCYGLVHIAQKALGRCRKKIPFESIAIGTKGDVVYELEITGR